MRQKSNISPTKKPYLHALSVSSPREKKYELISFISPLLISYSPRPAKSGRRIFAYECIFTIVLNSIVGSYTSIDGRLGGTADVDFRVHHFFVFIRSAANAVA